MRLTVVGGGLAGCEAAWQAAERGVGVVLREMRPARRTPAHRTDRLAELVCSNSFRSDEPTSAVGCLKRELRALGSLVMRCADAARIPGGTSLALDRERFAAAVTEAIAAHPRIEVVRGEVADVPPPPAVVATGPLTSDALAEALAARLGARRLFFHDAIAPIVEGGSLDRSVVFAASRHGAGDSAEGDYLNAPLSGDEYAAFIDALLAAEVHDGIAEDRRFFEGCLPVEEMARRGRETLRHGPMKPVGLADPRPGRDGRPPHAVVQFRREDLHGDLWNMVGFQTQMTIPAQERVLRLIPGMGRAVFVRHGSVHRNTYVDSPEVLTPCLEVRAAPGLFVAGQICGVEGYVESTAAGLAAGIFAAERLVSGRGEAPRPFPETTVIGGLLRYVSRPHPGGFQPMKAQWGLVPPAVPAGRRPGRREVRAATADRALRDLEAFRL
jgi:methylenetetrahydrofolate--tRNA-(uracil-5-)-methyltransferase